MDRLRFITHQGRQILLIDLSNCGDADVMKIVGEVQRIVGAQLRDSTLTLTDLTGVKASRSAVTRMKEVAVLDRPYVKRAAMVGAESLPKVFYEALKTFSQREFPRFETRQEAMDWLVTDPPEHHDLTGERKTEMSQRAFSLSTAVLFFLIALLHAVRLLRGWHVTIEGTAVPIWVSWIGIAIASYLAYQGFQLGRTKK